MNIGKFVLLTATLMLAMAFTFSCSRDSDENPFAQQYLYCVYPVEKKCVPGVVKECPQGGAPKDVCPAEFEEKAPSSSSARGSSSSSGGSGNDPFAGIPMYEYMKERLKYYDPDDRDERCQNGVVEGRCKDNNGDEFWYNPLTHVCGNSGDIGCDPDGYCAPSTTTYYFGTIERCGNELYASYQDNQTRRCQNGVLQRPCGDDWYSRETHYCSSGTPEAKERCGNKYYYNEKDYNDNYRCQNGVVEERCGSNWFNPETHYCAYYGTDIVKAIERCGNEYVNDNSQRCRNGVIEGQCGSGTWYNDITQSCDWSTGTVKAKVRCGSSNGTPSSSSARSCTAADNTQTQYCSYDELKTYGSVADAGGKTYKTIVIGSQTWMAENLNYSASGSECNNYGCVYNWETAKSVCPTGWHLPSRTEWEILSSYVGYGYNNISKHLKATSGWEDNNGQNGLNTYGFAAIPNHDCVICDEWWNSTDAYCRVVALRDGIAPDWDNEDNVCSVRCIKN